jgi:UDP-N-acetylglucosamine 2-epimerase (non-hydrolysing)
VQGDTTTVVAAAMLGYYHHVHVGHVEAGLRTGDRWQPFPEEINRRIAGVIADLHFAPTQENRQNLLKEGVPDERIAVTGNPVIDALQSIAGQPAPDEIIQLLQHLGISVSATAPCATAPCATAPCATAPCATAPCATAPCATAPCGKRLVLVTAHRRENFGQPLEDICTALKALAEHYAGQVEFVWPVHLNPNVQQPAYRHLSGLANLTLLPPLDYLPMVHMMKHSTLVLTDSGGLQEEAPALGVPTLVMRQTTERPEGITAGTLRLVGVNPECIFNEACRLLDDPAAHASMAHAANPFGDGHAAEHILRALLDFRL